VQKGSQFIPAVADGVKCNSENVLLMEEVFSIYALIDPRSCKIFYVGKTSRDPKVRYEEHINEVEGSSPKQKRIKEIYGCDYQLPDLVKLEEGIEGEKIAFTREVYWIEVFKMAGNVLTNASVDYKGTYFLTDSHLGPKPKNGTWKIDISLDELITTQDVNDEFFQIELYPTFTPIKSGNKKSDIDFIEKRDRNRLEGKLLNHGLPITIEEAFLIQHRCEQGDSLEELELYFQRSRKSIEYIAEINLETEYI
jgi:hypothetical protein